MIFPILPMLVGFAGMAFSIAYHSNLGAALSGVWLVGVLIADWCLLRQRAKRPGYNSWDEI